MVNNIYWYLTLAAFLTVSPPLSAEDLSADALAISVIDQIEADTVQKNHVAYHRDLAEQERTLAGVYRTNGYPALQNKHEALAAQQDALADAYEKSEVAP